MFLAISAMKATQPIASLANALGWPAEVPAALVRFIGVAEFLGGLGLILPAATRIKPMLTPLAGVGLATAMLFATIFHISHGEFRALPAPLGVRCLAAFVAWGQRGESADRAPVSITRSRDGTRIFLPFEIRKHEVRH
jgi:hypothetical protein